MKRLLQWIRSCVNRARKVDGDDERRYELFERALSVSPLKVYVYEEMGYRGSLILGIGEELHMVTPENLVSFRTLTRRERRHLVNKATIKHGTRGT